MTDNEQALAIVEAAPDEKHSPPPVEAYLRSAFFCVAPTLNVSDPTPWQRSKKRDGGKRMRSAEPYGAKAGDLFSWPRPKQDPNPTP